MNQPNSMLTLNDQQMQLFRYPRHLQHKSLQAWDAADEYLINEFISLQHTPSTKVAIINDEFGAIGCFLHDYQPDWYSDSKVAHLALADNLEHNKIISSSIRTHNSLTDFAPCQVYLLKLPKSQTMLAYQLAKLQACAPQNALVIAAGKTNQVTTAVLNLFEQTLGSTNTSLAKKKSRLIYTRVNKSLQPSLPSASQWQLEGTELVLQHHANVFARTSLDIGARFLLANLPDCNARRVVDLGCGNGVLGLSVLHKMTPKEVCFIDESWMAIASARHNVEANLGPSHPASFYWHNCLEDNIVDADVILCNPPFHQQNTITDHIAWQMFVDSANTLPSGGELRVVGNRHLDYGAKLKRLFGGFQVVATNKKFTIWSCFKR